MWYRFRQVFAFVRQCALSLQYIVLQRHHAIFSPVASASVSLSVAIVRTVPYAPAVASALAVPAYSAYTSARSAATQAQLNTNMLRAISWRSATLGPYGDYVAAALPETASGHTRLEADAAARTAQRSAGSLSGASALKLEDARNMPRATERVLSGVLDRRFASMMRKAGVLASSVDAALDALPSLRALAGSSSDMRFRVQLGTAHGDAPTVRRILVLDVYHADALPARAIWYRPSGKRHGSFYASDGRALQRGLDTRPVASARVSSHFGNRVHPISGRHAFHTGVDLAAPRGTPVRSSGHGTVTFTGWRHGYGKMVVLRHSNHYETMYAHLSRTAARLRPGMKVARGDVIGYVGSTGWATGPHLHYEVRHQGRYVNPLAASVGRPPSLTGTTLHAFERYSANLSVDGGAFPPRVAWQR